MRVKSKAQSMVNCLRKRYAVPGYALSGNASAFLEMCCLCDNHRASTSSGCQLLTCGVGQGPHYNW